MATKGDTVHDSGDTLGHSPTIYTAIANPVEMTDTTAAATEPSTVTEPSATDAASALPSSVKSNVSENKWPGWPGYCVFRLIVPVLKVGSIIGRKGELIKKICEETRARVRVLDAPLGTPDRVVLITGKEEPEAPLSPAMDAAIRVFKRVCDLSSSEGDSIKAGTSCSIQFLVASMQAINLIGKQGSIIKSMQESTGASVRVLPDGELPVYASADERIVDLQGEVSKVLKAVEAVVGHLRKFLVDQSVLPLFEKPINPNVTARQDQVINTSVDRYLPNLSIQHRYGSDYQFPGKREQPLLRDLESRLESQITNGHGLSLYGQDPIILSPRIGRVGVPFVTTVTQTMQIPMAYAEDIIGVGGAKISFIRRTSGAVLTVQETRGLPDEITVEIKGSSSQVQSAQQLIQDCINGHKETPTMASYSNMQDRDLRSSYPQLEDTAYTSSSYMSRYGGYDSSHLGGGYGSFRL